MGKLAKPDGDVYGKSLFMALNVRLARGDGTFHPADTVDACRVDEQRGFTTCQAISRSGPIRQKQLASVVLSMATMGLAPGLPAV